MFDGHNRVGLNFVMMVGVLLLLPGCGAENQDGGETSSAQLSIVFNQQQAAQLKESVSDIATIRVDISGPGLAFPRTASVPVSNPASGQEIPVSINAPVGSNRTIYLAAFNAGNTKLFSGSASGVTLPSGSPIPIVVALPFRVTVSKQGGGSGTVSSAPAGIACGSDCFDDFDAGDTVKLTASAASGSSFAGWSGGGCSGTGSCTVSVGAEVAAVFNIVVSTATLTVTTSGAGTVTSAPSGINCGDACSADFISGNSVTLTARPSGGSSFTGWSGGVCSGTSPCVVVMNGNQAVNAQFTAAPSTALLSVAKAGGGNGTVSSTPDGISCGGACSANFTSGSFVTLNATPTGGAMFAGWSGGGCSGTGACVVEMNGNQTVTADFTAAPSTATLTVTHTGTGTGHVSSEPAGIDCVAPCTFNFPSGASVTLTALASAGSTFIGWTGEGCSGTGPCVVLMTANRSVSAAFIMVIPSVALTVTVTGPGAGTVTSTPVGISCSSTCTVPFPSGTLVTLAVAPAGGSTFGGWSGGGCSGTAPCTVFLTTDQTVAAQFDPDPSMATLTVSRSGGGSGIVTSNPSGIDCGTTCILSFPRSSMVTLTATAAGGSTFDDWNGGGCNGNGACMVDMNQNRSVTARFSNWSIAAMQGFQSEAGIDYVMDRSGREIAVAASVALTL